MKHLSTNLEETKEIAKRFLENIIPGDKATVIALKGDLGAGKTSFTQEAGKLMGIEENMHSPTFVIEKIYPISFKDFTHLIHIDAYRIEKESELLHLGWNEILNDKENLIFIEWPERVEGIMPEGAKVLDFKFIDEATREIEIPE